MTTVDDDCCSRAARGVTAEARSIRSLTCQKGLHVNRVEEDQAGDRQLLMRIYAEHSNGRRIPLNVLIDTGADSNLIRKGMVSDLTTPARKPLTLYTADGSRMEGGTQEVSLTL